MREPVIGLSCPSCSGRLTLREGMRLVRCPFCGQSSILRGDTGVARFQVPCRIEPAQARRTVQDFFKGIDRAPGLRYEAEIADLMLVYVPFWAQWAQAVGWVFGLDRRGLLEPYEYRGKEYGSRQDWHWNTPACDVEEFGFAAIAMQDRPLRLYDSEDLHLEGLVFEPVGMEKEARERAQFDLEQLYKRQAKRVEKIDHIGSFFVRLINARFALVYYPFWIGRYRFNRRSYQVVLDGFEGTVLYGDAPGNPFLNAAVIVGGVALSTLLSLVIPGVLVSLLIRLSDLADLAGMLFCSMFGLMPVALAMTAFFLYSYRRYRFGGDVEVRTHPDGAAPQGFFRRFLAAGGFNFLEK